MMASKIKQNRNCLLITGQNMKRKKIHVIRCRLEDIRIAKICKKKNHILLILKHKKLSLGASVRI